MPHRKPFVAAIALAALYAAAAGHADGPDLSFRFRDERAPAGGIVQMKMETTEVTPISGGRPGFAFDTTMFEAVTGVGMFAPTGELAGAAVIDGNRVSIDYVRTAPNSDETPVMTVALRIRADATAGSTSSFTLNPSSRWMLNGALVNARVSPGLVTVGGSVAIADVIPGEGVVPVGTVVTIRGTGFNSRSRPRIDSVDLGSVRVISPTELRVTLRESANLTGARVRVDNPDLSRSIYYSYARGVPAATSGRMLLAATQPIFSGGARTQATIGPIPAMSGSQFAAVALQNPTLVPADVMLELRTADGVLLHSTMRSLANGNRLTLEVSELFDGVAPPAGAFVRAIASSPIQAFGLFCDEGAWTVTPRLPLEANIN